MMSAMLTLVTLLRDPAHAAHVAASDWTAIFSVARAEALIGTLAERLADQDVPDNVSGLFADVRAATAVAQKQALWEAEMCARAHAPINVTPVLLKGTAYLAAGLNCSRGRQIGDLDILVPRARLEDVEAALLAAGWEWLKSDPYDQAYYRDYMHELPPMMHAERDRMIDVHHTILPLTHRITPDAATLIAGAVTVANNHHVLNVHDRIVHSAAHLFADGDLAGGLRNLWDLHCLFLDIADWDALAMRARHHGLEAAVRRAARLAAALYHTPIAHDWDYQNRTDTWYIRHMMARDDWGRETQTFIRLLFYMRSHWLRMPPWMLARHLWIKWRKSKTA